MAGESTIAALLILNEESRNMPDWHAIEPQIQPLVQQYRNVDDTDEDAQTDIVRQIRRLFQRNAPALYQRLMQTIQALEQGSLQISDVRGIPSHAWVQRRITEGLLEAALPLGTNPEAEVTVGVRRYTDISCPQRAQLNERLTVTVALTLEPSQHSLVAQPLELNLEPVQMRIAAPRMTLLSPSEQTIAILPDADSPPVVFQLLPQVPGPAEITLEFHQQGQQVAAPVTFRVEIVEHEVAFTAAPYPPTLVDTAPARTVGPPDLTLRVYYDRGAARVLFALWREGVVIHEESGPAFAGAGPEAYVDSLYRELALLRQGRESVKVGGRGGRMLSEHDIERTLRRIGNRLWEKIIPPGLQLVYARERSAWRDAKTPLSMLLISDEPSIPWELLRPFGEDWEESFWCETFHFARWLPRHPDLSRQFAPATRIDTARVVVLAPEAYPELTAIKEEQWLLGALVARHRLQDQSPARPTPAAVLELLESGAYHWIHAVSHGDFLSNVASNSSVLWLEDRLSLSSEVITGPAMTRHLAQQRPGFVFNACHLAREGAALSGLEGWATQLVGRGAGLFLAPTWTVTDDLAASFAATFYTQLFDGGQSAAAAVWAARQDIKRQRPSDPTWLAYSLYAHPHLRVQVCSVEDSAPS